MKWRAPTAQERGLLDALLGVEFPGRDELRTQAATCRVRTLDDEGSLEIQAKGPPASVVGETPVDGEAEDMDGVILNAFLHVHDGLMTELEVVKADGSNLRRLPPAEKWRVVALE